MTTDAAARIDMRLPHWLRCHWMPWHDTKSGMMRESAEAMANGVFVIQERRCQVCNKVQLRLERT